MDLWYLGSIIYESRTTAEEEFRIPDYSAYSNEQVC